VSKIAGKGWRRDTPDYRDKVFLAEAMEIPPYTRLEHQSPVRDQGREGSCVGQSTASGIDYLDRTDNYPEEIVTFSARDIYYKARVILGTPKEDSGAEIRDAIKAIVRDGVCPNACWPYKEGEFKKLPPALAKRTAKSFRLGSYERCDTLDSIRIALANKNVVVGGFTCFSNMWTPEVDRTGVLPPPGGSADGGHAVLFVGYHDEKQQLIFKNSWSEGWGDKGYGYLPYEFVRRGLADDFWSLIKEL
jgi:hypothetical protein